MHPDLDRNFLPIMSSKPAFTPGWFSIPGAMRYTGFSESTIRKAIERGLIKASRIRITGTGKKPSIRIPRESLDAWLGN